MGIDSHITSDQPQTVGALHGAPIRSATVLTFRAQLLLAMSGLVFVTAVVVAIVVFTGAAAGSRAQGESLFREASGHAVTRARHHVLGVAPVIRTLAQISPSLALDDSDRLALQLADVLRVNGGLTWLSFSNTAGAFTAAYRTPDGTIRLNQSRLENGKTRLLERDVLADGTLRTVRTDDDSGYDPRTRPFFRRATEEGRLVWLPPYVFFGTNVPGITAAVPVRDGAGALAGVFTADFDLDALSKFIGSLSVSSGSRFFLYTDRQVLLAYPRTSVTADAGSAVPATAATRPVEPRLLELKDIDDPLARAYRAHLPAAPTSVHAAGRDGDSFQSFRFEHDGATYLASATTFRVDDGVHWVVGALAPEDDFVGPARRGQRIGLAVACGAALAACVVAALVSRRVSRPVGILSKFMERVGQGDLDERVELRGAADFRRLSATLNQMIDDLRDRVRMRYALSVAMDVQQRLLPAAPPAVPGLDIAGHSTYCDETGGDYYDYLTVDEVGNRGVLIALGDVMGHGVAAALIMAGARAILRSRARGEGNLARLVSHLNDLLVNDLQGKRFMTMHLSIIDLDRMMFRWASAGHDPALIYDAMKDRFEEIDVAGLPLGVSDDADYQEAQYQPLHAGQIILIGTDGIWETQNPAGELFDKDRLREIVRETAHLGAAEIINAIITRLDAFRGRKNPADDVTLVVLKILGDTSRFARQMGEDAGKRIIVE